ncbi:helix-turn-helix domain-containing protein [Paenibacillus camerounensis]|uniref:helix-turn-helix domain-containing protein n=1 Tax=Paenibacillus camerounensis TaxID=1243663 RepID=UPI0005A9585B|nr:helix-turn-helix domain-containing protein [Paenibacillus camerounensis]
MEDRGADGPYPYRLLYNLNSIETFAQPWSDNRQPGCYPVPALIIVSDGQGWIEAGGQRYQLDKGAGFLFECGAAGRISAGEQGVSFYRLNFEVIASGENGMYAMHNFPEEGLLQSGPIQCRPFPQIIMLLESIQQCLRSLEHIEHFAAQSRFQELLLLLMRANPYAAVPVDERTAVQRSIQYMQEHFNETVTVDGLAEIAGLGRSRFTRLFKEQTGQIPLEYLNGLRIERAQQQLLMSKDRLHEIALAVGYSNEYYFSRRFKGSVGVTPGKYRSLYQEGTRIFAPFLEDYLLALGIMPVAQYCHADWGKQDYLGLHQIPAFDISTGDWQGLSRYTPELIMLDDGFQRWHLEECSQVAPLFKLPFHQENWRATLRSAAAIFGRSGSVQEVIGSYEDKVRAARERLSRSAGMQTVAVLRISSAGIMLYGCDGLGYTGGVLHSDLGLQPHPLVRQLCRGQKQVNLSLEALAQLTADHLFITFDRQMGEGRELLESPLWSSLPAARSGCVYEMDFMAWMNYGVMSHHRKIADVLQVLA